MAQPSSATPRRRMGALVGEPCAADAVRAAARGDAAALGALLQVHRGATLPRTQQEAVEALCVLAARPARWLTPPPPPPSVTTGYRQ